MFIFNTTFMVEKTTIPEWQKWMERNYLPTMKDLVKNLRVELYEVLAVVDEGTTNFSCQLQCYTPDNLETINKYNSILVDNLKGTFGEKCLTFSSVLKEVNPVE